MTGCPDCLARALADVDDALAKLVECREALESVRRNGTTPVQDVSDQCDARISELLIQRDKLLTDHQAADA